MYHITSSQRPARSGYTLIELLITIAILGIASAVLIPQMGNLSALEVQAAVRTIIADLSFAQSDALANQEFRRVHFYPDGSGYCLIRVAEGDFFKAFDYSDAAPVADAPEYIIDPLGGAGLLERYIMNFETDTRFQQVVIESVVIDGNPLLPNGTDITYDSLGGTVQSPNTPGISGRIVVSSTDERFEIIIAPFTGKLTVKRLP